MVNQEIATSFPMIKRGVLAGIPIMLGYLPIAIAYGVLARQTGLSLAELTLMSVLVFAGASQFMGGNMIGVGAGAIEIVVATFVLNFLHFIMSMSFMNQLIDISLNCKISLSLGLTVETFAVFSLHTKEAKMEKGVLFYTALFITAWLAWILGSLLGGVLGDVIPEKLSQSMGIALYAMFIGLLVPSVKKELKVSLIAVCAMLLNSLFSLFVSDGWSIVLGSVLGGSLGIVLLKEDEV